MKENKGGADTGTKCVAALMGLAFAGNSLQGALNDKRRSDAVEEGSELNG